jgi:urease accessory protein
MNGVLVRESGSITPIDLPGEVSAFAAPVRGSLDVGAKGKVGVLDLTLAQFNGVTRVRDQYQQAPLHVYRPIYLDRGRPDMAFMFVQQFGDGFVQGDRCRIDIRCEPSSAAHVTTQAASKVFVAHQNFATQLVNLYAGAGAVLEYLPDPVIPFRGSRFFQRTCVTVDSASVVILGETLLPGRVARGEAHVYDLFWAETEVYSVDGSLLFADVVHMNPSEGEDPKSAGLLGAYDVLATLYVVSGESDPSELVSLLRRELEALPAVLVGVSALPNDCGATVRMLGSTSRAVQSAMATAWNAARVALLDVSAPDLRKG